MSTTNNTLECKTQTTAIAETLHKALALLEEKLLSKIPTLQLISITWNNCTLRDICTVHVWSPGNEATKELLDYARQAKDAEVKISVLKGGEFHHRVLYRQDDYTLEIIFIANEPAAVEHLVNPGVRDEQ